MLISQGYCLIAASMDLGPLDRVFGSLSRRANDWREPFREIGLIALDQFDHRFAVGGPGWPPNKKGTQTLVKTGRLRRSFTQVGNPDNLFRVTPSEATFGSKLFYAKILQKGGVVKNSAPKLGHFQKLAGLRRLPASYSVLPPRPIVVAPDRAFQKDIGRVAYRHFVDGIQEGLR